MFGGPPFAHPVFGRAKKAEPKPDAASAKFVKDLTVNDQSEKAPNEAFEKAWVLSAGKTGVPAGCSLVFIGGHHLNASELRVPVEGAPIAHGDEFVLRVNLRAPAEPGHYRSFWRLQTPAGRRFGPRIWADIMVAEPTSAAAAAAAQQSQDKAKAAAPSMTFAEDITIPDGQQVLVGSKLRKTWLVSTATGWDAGCVLRCTDMWSSFAGMSEAVPAVPAGSQAEISITLTAPSKPGHYRSYWALADASGRQFGDQLFVEFNAVNELASGTNDQDKNIDHEKAIEEALSEVAADAQADAQAVHQAAHEQAHAAAVEAAAAAAAAAAVKAADATAPKHASSSTGGGGAAAEGGANLGEAANNLANNLLQQILAGINVAPDSQNANLSDLLFRALSSNDFSAVLAELKKLNINISTE
jgi:hypothetical protein